MPPADATALAIALERAVPSAPATRSAGFIGWIEWLLPRPRLAIATSALATFAIVAVGIDIALHTNPQFRQVIQSQSSPAGGSDTSGVAGYGDAAAAIECAAGTAIAAAGAAARRSDPVHRRDHQCVDRVTATILRRHGGRRCWRRWCAPARPKFRPIVCDRLRYSRNWSSGSPSRSAACRRKSRPGCRSTASLRSPSPVTAAK